MNYQAVIFDLDGTLLDTLADLADSMNRALRAEGLAEHDVEAYRHLVGDGIYVLAERAAPAALRDEALRERLVAGMRGEYAKRWAEKTRPYEGVAEMLDELARREVPAAVLSNKPHDFTQLCVAELLPHWKFAAVRGVDERTPVKPDPTGALAVAAELGVEPADVLYVGDTNTDMRTAVAAGMHATGATWGFRSARELHEAGAAVLIDAPGELLSLL